MVAIVIGDKDIRDDEKYCDRQARRIDERVVHEDVDDNRSDHDRRERDKATDNKGYAAQQLSNLQQFDKVWSCPYALIEFPRHLIWKLRRRGHKVKEHDDRREDKKQAH